MNPEQKRKNLFLNPLVQSIAIIVVVFGALIAFLYYESAKFTVLIENSYLEAPVANLSSGTSGVLNAVYVKEGDSVKKGDQLVQVGSETIYAKDDGIVDNVPKVLGVYYAPGQTVISVIATGKMMVVGALDETKGLEKIKAGQIAKFTVDAFPGKTYSGVVDSVSPSSKDMGIVFSISDKRPVKQFDVNVTYDTARYPELKNGMSAKIKVDTRK